MDTVEVFQAFIENLDIKNTEDIYLKFKTITKSLNFKYFGHKSESENSLIVGSLGRNTAIHGVSDLDMIFILPKNEFERYDSYENNGQSALLQDVKNIISQTYSTTDIRGDGQVVVIQFSDYIIELCPCFLQDDSTYLYPDSNSGGKWKLTNPILEINEINKFNLLTKNNLHNLAKITRAWKNKCGVKIGGLLIDTLCYDFLKNNIRHQNSTLLHYDILLLNFFEYLKNYEKQRSYWFAPGSNQKVYRKQSNFIAKAKIAFEHISEAILKKDNDSVFIYWKKVFGYPFPYPEAIKEASVNYTSAEEFIEDTHSVDVRFTLRINCEVKQDGYKTKLLRDFLTNLKVNKKLKFFIEYTDVIRPFSMKWKIKNEGDIAKRRNNLRGQIVKDDGTETRNENTNFGGSHFVECYIIKNNICVARDRIDVPISAV
jgi:hypothetical protein